LKYIDSDASHLILSLFSTFTTCAQQGAGKNKKRSSVRKTTRFKAISKTIIKKKIIIDPESKAVGRIWRTFRRISDGADGGVVAMNGNLRPTSLVRVFRALKIVKSEVFDMGAGDGRALHAAMAGGASTAKGFELPANKAHKFVFDAVCKELHSDAGSILSTLKVAWSKAEWCSQDIDSIRRIPGNSRPGNSQRVYSFWVGMPPQTQTRILRLSAQSPAVKAIAVFRDRKWPKPESGQPAFCASNLPSTPIFSIALSFPLDRTSYSFPLLLHLSMLTSHSVFCSSCFAKTFELRCGLCSCNSQRLPVLDFLLHHQLHPIICTTQENPY
jgi:hypothetical protein